MAKNCDTDCSTVRVCWEGELGGPYGTGPRWHLRTSCENVWKEICRLRGQWHQEWLKWFKCSEVRMKEAELDISHSFYMILHHFWMFSKINSGYVRACWLSTTRCGLCCATWPANSRSTREGSKLIHISIFECSFCYLMFLGFCVLTREFGV